MLSPDSSCACRDATPSHPRQGCAGYYGEYHCHAGQFGARHLSLWAYLVFRSAAHRLPRPAQGRHCAGYRATSPYAAPSCNGVRPLRKNPLATMMIATTEATGAEPQTDRAPLPGEIRNAAQIAAGAARIVTGKSGTAPLNDAPCR